ncbi:MAG: preprotein translocase subunit SecG [Alphaproteobacteria bacterium]|nr:preprotein translocase subunit SecG [Alphaproteobacteria bacterium]
MNSFILVVHILLAFGITVLVLLQRSEGGLGGLGGNNSAANFLTSRQTGNLLSKLTKYFFAGFVCTSLTLVIMAKNATRPENISLVPVATETPVETPTES